MLSPELLHRIFQWEVRTWSRAYPLWHRTLEDMGRGSQALALGERHGGFSLLLALHGASVVCSDLNGPTDTARELHRSEGVANNMHYEAIDMLAIPYPDASFDVVTFKSVIGALGTKERQRQAMAEIHRVLKPRGVLLLAENLTGTVFHRWLRKHFVPWDAYWRYLDAEQDRDLFQDFSSVELHATGVLANLGRTERQRDVLALVDGMIGPWFPERMRTVWFGVAYKGIS